MTFDMTFDPTKSCQTRDGRKARIICTDADRPAGYTLIALVCEYEGPGESTKYFQSDGSTGIKDDLDSLINTPEEYEVTMYLFNSVKQGEKYIRDTNVSAEAIASKKVVFVEGEFAD